MEIEQINKEEVIRTISVALDLPLSDQLDDTLICGSLRRLAGFLCPCSSVTLITTLTESLKDLSLPTEILHEAIEENLERLIVWGDLLELSDVSTNDVNTKGNWLFAATPAFFIRSTGTVLLCGITPDENSPVQIFANRIIYDGCKRYINYNPSEDLPSTLRELGLIEFSERFWFKMPKKITPEDLFNGMNRHLDESGDPGEFSDVQILDWGTDVSFYNGRWKPIKGESGRYVARRPFVYGNATWCFVDLADGIIKGILDMPLKMGGVNLRGCDSAWHLQMAIDRINKKPQYYSIEDVESGKLLSFYSPIPLWAERRLISLGTFSKVKKQCLFSYLISERDLVEEEKFLRDYLWLDQKK